MLLPYRVCMHTPLGTMLISLHSYTFILGQIHNCIGLLGLQSRSFQIIGDNAGVPTNSSQCGVIGHQTLTKLSCIVTFSDSEKLNQEL